MTQRVAIVGTGFGGLGMASRLRRAGIPFTLFERSDRLGGTWRDNVYPGAACDVPSRLYSFSFHPKHDWLRAYAEQPEILSYLEDLAERHQLLPHIRFGTEIARAVWDGAWRLEDTRGQVHTADVLVTACGQLSTPVIPRLPGAERFQGPQFHSAAWDHGAALAGKRVAVIGTGASAVQFVPPVAAVASHLTVFQRSPNWILPKKDRAYRGWEKALARALPVIPWLRRLRIYWEAESRFFAFKSQTSLLGRAVKWLASTHLRKQVADPALRARLTPDYQVGCKRVLISSDYYPALCRPNVSLVTDAACAIEEDAVVDAAGVRHPADVIIYGTGFASTRFLTPMQIVGRDGRSLDEAWAGGAEAYLGMTVAGFPNLFLLYGPNTNLGHNSILFMLEAQFRYVVSALRALGERRWMELEPERMRAFNEEMQERLARSVWNAGCTSWYRTAEGKQTNNWPGFTVEYWRRTRRVDLGDYRVGPP